MAISLKSARVNSGLTQIEVAKIMGISKLTLSNYENYKCVPNIEMAMKLANLYKLSIDDIIFFKKKCAESTM